MKHTLLAENARSRVRTTDFRLPFYSSTPSYQPLPQRAQNYNIDTTDDKEAHKYPVEKNFSAKRPFSTSRSDSIRIGLRIRTPSDLQTSQKSWCVTRLGTHTKLPCSDRFLYHMLSGNLGQRRNLKIACERTEVFVHHLSLMTLAIYYH